MTETADIPSGESEGSLTAKQQCFVAEYLVDLNATQAAIRAGYSEHSAPDIGCENLTKPQIRAAIDAAMAERAKRTEITQDRVLAELAKIAFADIRKAVAWGDGLAVTDAEGNTTIVNGVSLVGSSKVGDESAAAIAEICQTREGIKIKFHDKRAALVDIGRHLGMFVDKVEHSGSLTLEQALEKIGR